ncbi:MAG: integration host factor, actinobacterial type, partial [Rhodoglobus sp.]
MSPRPAPPEVDRAAASQAASAARRARAAVKRQVASRERTAADVASVGWADPTSPEASMRVRELLLSVPTLGPTRVERVLDQLQISEKKRVGGLGPRQRERLHAFLVARQGVEPARLVVLAGPTAVGKGTVSAYSREHFP